MKRFHHKFHLHGCTFSFDLLMIIIQQAKKMRICAEFYNDAVKTGSDQIICFHLAVAFCFRPMRVLQANFAGRNLFADAHHKIKIDF